MERKKKPLHIKELTTEVLTRIVEAIIENPDLPEWVFLPKYVYGYEAVADLLEKHGTGAIKIGTLGKLASRGAIPTTGNRVSHKLEFSVKDVLQWDRAGRPDISQLENQSA